MTDKKHTPATYYETNPFKILLNSTTAALNTSQTLAIILIVATCVITVMQFIFQIFGEVFDGVLDKSADISSAVTITGSILLLLGSLLLIFVGVMFNGLRGYAAASFLHKKDAKFGEAFSAIFEKFWKILAIDFLKFLYTLPYIVGLAALIILTVAFAALEPITLAISMPIGIPLAVFLMVLSARVYMRYEFSTVYLFDENTGIGESMNKSQALSRGRLAEVFGLTSISSYIPFLSSLVQTAGIGLLYGQLKEARHHGAQLPKKSIWNYTVLFVIGGFMLLILPLAVVLFFAATVSN